MVDEGVGGGTGDGTLEDASGSSSSGGSASGGGGSGGGDAGRGAGGGGGDASGYDVYDDSDEFVVDLDDDDPMPRALSPSGFDEFVMSQQGVRRGPGSDYHDGGACNGNGSGSGSALAPLAPAAAVSFHGDQPVTQRHVRVTSAGSSGRALHR